MQLNGKQTIYQMIRLADEVRRRGGEPEDPAAYKARYHDLLIQRIAHRHRQLESNTVSRDEMLVPHTMALLDDLRSRGVTLYLASGTDEPYVLREAKLLGLDAFFGKHIYGAQEDYRSFSKAQVIERILADNHIDGSSLLGFGDGYVEIQNVKAVGGIAVAVASDEAQRSGKPDAWKRDRLIGVGADFVIPDYRHGRLLLDYLWQQPRGSTANQDDSS
jgi:phosphoglycolate phosphatase-like HAD superfamily hydrolase